MRSMKVISLFFARVFLSSIFIISALKKVFNWYDTENNLISVLVEWHSYVNKEFLKDFFTSMLPWAPLVLVLATILELFGGLLILFGIKARFGAVLLILFLIPTTIVMHHFWFLENPTKQLELAMFMKNLAIIGGLLFVSVFGAKLSSPIPQFKRPSFDD